MSDQPLIDVRCPNCQKLLFQVDRLGSVVKTKCPRCGAMVQWPALEPALVPRRDWPPKIETKEAT